MSFLQYCVEDRGEIAGRRIDDLQHLGDRGLLGESLITLGFALVTLGFALGKFSVTLGKLTFEIGYPLLGIAELAVGRRAHLRTSSGPTIRVDHSVIDTGYHRSPIGMITAAREMTAIRASSSVPLLRRTAGIVKGYQTPARDLAVRRARWAGV